MNWLCKANNSLVIAAWVRAIKHSYAMVFFVFFKMYYYYMVESEFVQ